MRITLLIVAGFIVFAGGGFLFLMKSISSDVEQQYSQASEEPLVDFAHLFASLLEENVKEGRIDVADFREGFKNAYRREFLARIYQLEKRQIYTGIYVTDGDGIVIFDSENGLREGEDYSEYNDVYLARQGKYGVRATRANPNDSESTVFYIAAPVYHDEEMIGTLTVSRPETAMVPFAQESRRSIIRSGWITALVVFVLVTLWAYLVLYPIRHLTLDAQRIAQGKQDRVEERGLAELHALSLALENMRRELEGKHYVENYVQALTHELKSPLAAIRGAAELIDESMPEEKRRKFLDNILVETTRSEDMVRRLVQLAVVEGQQELEKKEAVDLGALVREEIFGLASIIENRSLEIHEQGLSGGKVIQGEPLMLRIAVRNLLSNAFDFSAERGVVEISLVSGDLIELCVRDHGVGLPDYAVDRVFERFYSLKNEATGRKGSGIGLSFVKATMELHGGTASLRDGECGGAVATLVFPL